MEFEEFTSLILTERSSLLMMVIYIIFKVILTVNQQPKLTRCFITLLR